MIKKFVGEKKVVKFKVKKVKFFKKVKVVGEKKFKKVVKFLVKVKKVLVKFKVKKVVKFKKVVVKK